MILMRMLLMLMDAVDGPDEFEIGDAMPGRVVCSRQVSPPSVGRAVRRLMLSRWLPVGREPVDERADACSDR